MISASEADHLSPRPQRVSNPLQWGETFSGAPVSSRRLVGSVPVLVRRWRGVSPEIEQPALDHHYVTLHLGGPKRIRRKRARQEALNDIAEGAFSFAPAGSAYSWSTEGPVDFAHVYFRPSSIDHVVLTEFNRDPRQMMLHEALGARDPLLEALLLSVVTEGSTLPRENGGRLYWEGLLHTLVCRLLHLHSTLTTVDATAPHALAPYRVRKVVDFVEANLAQDIGLSDLAATAGVSAFHFTRGFHRATGYAPYAFLISRRLERAKVLLKDSDLPLSTVAEACGFGSPSHFSRTFKRAIGASPSRYRAFQ